MILKGLSAAKAPKQNGAFDLLRRKIIIVPLAR